MKNKINAFLKEVNSHSKYVKVVCPDISNTVAPTFKVVLNSDPFVNTNDHPINVSDFFDKTIEDLGYKHFGKTVRFNTTHSTFWFFV